MLAETLIPKRLSVGSTIYLVISSSLLSNILTTYCLRENLDVGPDYYAIKIFIFVLTSCLNSHY